jgi:hypothetical protein
LRNVSYEDEIYMASLVLQELDYGVKLDVQSVRFLDRYQADIAFLDEALADYHGALRSNPQLPGRQAYLRSLHRVEAEFATFLSRLTGGSSALGKALAPLHDSLVAMQRRHAELAREAQELLTESSEGAGSGQPVISDEEFRILLADEGPAD